MLKPSFRRDVELPGVTISDEHAASQATVLLERTVDCEIPGFAIVDDIVSRPEDVREKHKHHEKFILAALAKSVPRLNHGEFLHISRTDFGSGTGLHMDLFGTSLDTLSMILRLHTSAIVGAQVMLANGKVVAPIGDEELFGGGDYVHEAARWRGYDMQGQLHSSGALLRVSEAGVTEPEYCEPTIFHFQQKPGTSILFRSMCGIGPASAHGFTTLEGGTDRPTFTSDVPLIT